MCGRITLTDSKQIDFSMFGIHDAPSLPGSYNIAPGRPLAVIRTNPSDARRELVFIRWGLLPHWCQDSTVSYINARSETAHAMPAFRTALAHRRCLILADGFYLWKKSAGKRQPYHVNMKNRKPFAFAGIWECWRDETQVIRSCAILTTGSNNLLENIDERMPVIMRPQDYNLWLDAGLHNLKKVQRLMRRWTNNQMKAFPVSLHVNNPHNDDPRCVEPRSESCDRELETMADGLFEPMFAMAN